jgi:phosphoglycolate phosphatase
MAEAGAAPESTVMIGDTSYDIDMALAAGPRALGVGWGYHAPSDLIAAGAHGIAMDSSELSNHIRAK